MTVSILNARTNDSAVVCVCLLNCLVLKMNRRKSRRLLAKSRRNGILSTASLVKQETAETDPEGMAASPKNRHPAHILSSSK